MEKKKDRINKLYNVCNNYCTQKGGYIIEIDPGSNRIAATKRGGGEGGGEGGRGEISSRYGNGNGMYVRCFSPFPNNAGVMPPPTRLT